MYVYIILLNIYNRSLSLRLKTDASWCKIQNKFDIFMYTIR